MHSYLPYIFLALLSASALAQDSDYTCSATKPCAVGCCGKSGVCGLGPKFCGEDTCLSNCDQKSECDPGWGHEWASASKCPLNVCCSEYGFCGTTKDFCKDEPVKAPVCDGAPASEGRMVGYYEGWATSRKCNAMVPEQLPTGMFTHLNFAFAFIDPDTYEVAPMSDEDQHLYPRFTGLKENNSGLETWISIGGWSMNDPDQPTARTFSDLVASPEAQETFFASLRSFMKTWGFDGVDVDWEYPVAPERSGRPADYDNFVSFLSRLRDELHSDGDDFGLTITLPSSYWYLKNFDIVKLADIVDWFNVMTYDLQGTWDADNQHIGAEVYAHTNLTEINQTMDLFWRNEIDPKKIVMGTGFYGRSFTLKDPGCTGPGCAFVGGGEPGDCSQSAGTLAYSEIQNVIATGVKPTLDEKAAVKQLVWNEDQWVSFDDEDTFKVKADYANSKCLGGIMVWAVSTDSSKLEASSALGKAMGVRELSLLRKPPPKEEDFITQCIWGECDAACPKGTAPASIGTGKVRGNALIYHQCPKDQTRFFCCPSGASSPAPPPTCEWRGSAPSCQGKCHRGEVAVTSDTSGDGHSCWSGHKVLCCKRTSTSAAFGQCKWEGAAPACSSNPSGSYGCDEKGWKELTTSKYGAGGEAGCKTGQKIFPSSIQQSLTKSGKKSLCCAQPEAFKNCKWSTRKKSISNQCINTCPSGQAPIASDDSWCNVGTRSMFCCDIPRQSSDLDRDGLNLDYCPVRDDMFLRSEELDTDNNPNDFVEVHWFEDQCYSTPNYRDPDQDARKSGTKVNVRRNTDVVGRLLDLAQRRGWPSGYSNQSVPRVCSREGNCQLIDHGSDPHVTNLLEYVRTDPKATLEWIGPRGHSPFQVGSLLPRGGDRKMVLCFPNGENSRITATGNYPRVGALALARPAIFWSVTKFAANVCRTIQAGFGARQAGNDYCTEHVHEIQVVKMFAQSMLDGKLPSIGGVPPSVRNGYDWSLVFRQHPHPGQRLGYFYMTWTQLNVRRPDGLDGNTPEQTLTRAIAKRFENLLICEATTNGLKGTLFSLHKNLVGRDRFNDADFPAKVSFVQMVVRSLVPYLNSQESQDALEWAYHTMFDVFNAIDMSTKGGMGPGGGNPFVKIPPGSSIANEFEHWYGYYTLEMQDIVQTFAVDRMNALQRSFVTFANTALGGVASLMAQKHQAQLNTMQSTIERDAFIDFQRIA